MLRTALIIAGLALVPLTDAFASGYGYGLAVNAPLVQRQRVVQRQPLLGRFRQRQKLVVQQQAAYAVPLVQKQIVQKVVQPIYAAPVVQPVVVKQKFYAQPVVVQPYVQQQVLPNCAYGQCQLQQLQQYNTVLPQCH